MKQTNKEPNFPIDKLSKALFIINRHAKTAPDSKFLYKLKHEAIKKMLTEGKAKKIGLHFSRNPKFSQQQLDVLISCGNYYFHIPPTKDDIHSLENLGKLDEHVRNPKTVFPLKEAKRILQLYTGIKANSNVMKSPHIRYQKPVFKRLGE
ncbi:YkyB family protein [Caldibacillus lycopersici]|uniref:YkyB family protein n=1 Tax=Perspicuibacillus lycopersici TaxID=1325689 RepID=A0AAE3IPM7_9BACI|nr:YkyB family protein [Perspicuibacillus lycopersici]MCU9612275.1 YkyB family protein [Perspicuibacillus lycopersici]